MLCVIPYFSGDHDQAVRLAEWIATLGGVKNHDCLLVIDRSASEEGVIGPFREEAFRSVQSIWSEPSGPQGAWGTGTTDATAANQMWMTANVFIYHKLKVPFFWLEPDAVPTRSTWLDELESEYKASGKKFMGAYVNIPPHEPHMSGVACYPPNVADWSLAMMTPGPIAWDYAGRRDTVVKEKAHFTDLIQHEYRIHGESPTFPTVESLSVIKPRTAVFHRCKDSSLVDRLREQLSESPIGAVGEPPESVLDAATTPQQNGFVGVEVVDGFKARIRELEEALLLSESTEADAAPQTMADQMRGLCRGLAAIVGDKPGRRAQAQTFLREVSLMGPAKTRMKRKKVKA